MIKNFWHIGHQAILQKAFEQKLVDKVFIFEEKVRIIQDFLVGFKYDAVIDTIEQDKDGSWRTIDLVQYFKNLFPNDELYLIIGEDSFKEFKTWTRYEDILQDAKLIVANRKEHVTKTKTLTEKGEIPAIPLDMGRCF